MEYVYASKRVVVVTLPGHRPLDREACLETLMEANRLGSRLELLVIALSPDSAADELLQLVNGFPPSAVILCAPESRTDTTPLSLEGAVAAAMKAVWKQDVYLCALGGAARLLADHGLLRKRRVVVGEAQVAGLKSAHPDTTWVTRLTYLQDGNLLSCTGLLASAEATLHVLDLLGESRLTYRIASRLMQFPEGTATRTRPAPEIPLAHPALHRVVDLLARNPTHAWTSASLARAVYVSERHLQRLFREVVGCGVLEYLQRRRLTKAIEALRSHPVMSLQKVAEISGFSSTQHLRRAWRKAHGSNPSSLRHRSAVADPPKPMNSLIPADLPVFPEKNEWSDALGCTQPFTVHEALQETL